MRGWAEPNRRGALPVPKYSLVCSAATPTRLPSIEQSMYAPRPVSPGPHEVRGDGVCRVEPGAEVSDRDTALDRTAAGLSGDAHQPAHALHGDVEGALARVGSGLAVPRDRAVHDSRIAGADRGVVRAEPREHPGTVVLDEHVGGIGEPKQPIDAGAVLEVEGDAALVAVERGEVLAIGRSAAGGARTAAASFACRRLRRGARS